jgi:hypothetical protein
MPEIAAGLTPSCKATCSAYRFRLADVIRDKPSPLIDEAWEEAEDRRLVVDEALDCMLAEGLDSADEVLEVAVEMKENQDPA